MFKRINARAFVSLSVLSAFGVMLVTSILMFVNRHTTSTAMMHTIVGFTLLLLALWHLKNNFSPLKEYFRFRARRTGTRAKAPINIAMPVALVLGAGIAILSFVQFRPFLAFYEWGSSLRAGEKVEQRGDFSYVQIDNTPEDAVGLELKIDLRKGPYFAWPQYAVWLETESGEFIQPLFVTAKLATNSFTNVVTRKDDSLVFTSNPITSGEYDPEVIFDAAHEPETAGERIRPESLPVFLHKLGLKTDDGVYVPSGDSELLDGHTGATVLDNFLLSSRTNQLLTGSYKVRMEINQSFDFNEYYSSDRFPDDPIYSGSGFSAQPSVVYEAIIDPESDQKYYPMELVGRGHHSGRNGTLYKDVENLTTALGLVDRIIVELGGR